MSTSSFGQTKVTMARVIRAGPVLSLCFLDISQGSAKMSHPSSAVAAPRPPSLPPHHPPHPPPLAPPLAPLLSPSSLPPSASLNWRSVRRAVVRPWRRYHGRTPASLNNSMGPTVEKVPWSDPRRPWRRYHGRHGRRLGMVVIFVCLYACVFVCCLFVCMHPSPLSSSSPSSSSYYYSSFPPHFLSAHLLHRFLH